MAELGAVAPDMAAMKAVRASAFAAPAARLPARARRSPGR